MPNKKVVTCQMGKVQVASLAVLSRAKNSMHYRALSRQIRRRSDNILRMCRVLAHRGLVVMDRKGNVSLSAPARRMIVK